MNRSLAILLAILLSALTTSIVRAEILNPETEHVQENDFTSDFFGEDTANLKRQSGLNDRDIIHKLIARQNKIDEQAAKRSNEIITIDRLDNNYASAGITLSGVEADDEITVAEAHERKEDIKSQRDDITLVVHNAQRANYVLDLEKAQRAEQMGYLEAAIKIYKEVLRENPDNYYTNLSLANLYYKEKRWDEAKKIYIKILDSKNDDHYALNNYLALLIAEQPADLVKEFKKLEAVFPYVSFIPAQIGVYYYQQNQFEKALKYFRKARQLDYQNSTYAYYLALVYERLGYKQEAINNYRDLMRKIESGQEVPIDARQVQHKIMTLYQDYKG